MSQEKISFDELAVLLIQNAPDNEDLTIVGGRAVEYWTAYYQSSYPELFEGIEVIGTRDLDYVLQSKESMDNCINAWNEKLKEFGLKGQKAEVPMGDHSPEVGHNSIEVDPEASRENRWFLVDFLFDLHGISKDEIRNNRVHQEYPWQTAHYILNEYMTLANRAFNVATIPGKNDAKGLSQLKQAVAINKSYLMSLLDVCDSSESTRGVLKEIGKIAKLANRKDIGVKIFVNHDINLLDAIPADHPALPDNFVKKGWPQTEREFSKRAETLRSKMERLSPR